MRGNSDIKAIQLFTGFDDGEIKAFVDAAVRKKVPAGHMFFAMGNSYSSLFIIRSGSVKVVRLGTSDDLPLATLAAGESFGEMSFMDGSRTTGTVSAQGPTEVYEISRRSVDKLLAEKPAIGAKFWRNIALGLKQRLSRANEVIDQYVEIDKVMLRDQSLREYYGRL
jgi:CRP-like cAMP-binding protein